MSEFEINGVLVQEQFLVDAAKVAPIAALQFVGKDLPEQALIDAAKATPWAALQYVGRDLPEQVLAALGWRRAGVVL